MHERTDQSISPVQLLLSEQVKIAYGSTTSSVAGNIINCTILVALLWSVADQYLLVGWCSFIIAISAWRGFDAWLFCKHGEAVTDSNYWERRFSIGAVLGAIGWSAAVVLLFQPDSIAHQVLLAFIIAGMTAGATVVLSALWLPGLAYLLLPLLPLSIQFLQLDGDIALGMGVMILLYLAVLISVARKIHANTLQNIRLRIESGLHEEELSESEAKFRLLFESVEDAIFISNAEGYFIDVNPVAYRRLGYSKEEMLALHISDLNSSKYAATVSKRMEELRKVGRARFETEHLYKNGERMPVEINTRIVDYKGERVQFSVVRDLTDRKLAEKELKQSEERFRGISTSMPDWIWELDERGVYTYVSGKVKEVLGYEPEEVIGKTPFDLMDHAEARRVGKVFHGISASKSKIVNLENWNLTRDGQKVCVLTNGVPILNESGELKGYRGVDQDITERRHAEDELRKLSRAIENAGESVVITNASGTIEYVNPAFSRLTGYSEDEAIGSTPAILNSGEQSPQFYQNFWDTITSGEVWKGSLIDRHKDGTLYSAMMTVAPIAGEQGEITHFVAMQLDMSEYEELEARFQQSQKMEAIGTLVGGIAHDFNNMLAALMGNLYLAKSSSKANPEMVERLDRIESVSQRAADMIGQLLTFARKGKVEMNPLALAPFLKEIFKLARPSIPENIHMRLELHDEDMLSLGDVTQLQQVILNLITNSSHALEGVAEPEIVVGLNRYEPDSRFHHVHDLSAATLALLYVRDNGCGIGDAELDKVFEPFYTTKEAGKGSGLGLSMVHGAMKTHKGAVEIYSEPSMGTTVHLYLPLEERDSLSESSGLKSEVEKGRGEGVLLVDDEALVREVNAEVLEDLGYRVFMAENGLHAQALFQRHVAEIGIAVVDMVMPKMGGLEFVSWLREKDAELPVILMTGYDRDHALAKQKMPERSAFLNKPVDVTEFSRLVREMLEV